MIIWSPYLNIGDLRLELGKARRVAGHGRGHLLRRLRALELGDQLVLVGGHLLLLGLQTLDLGGEVFLPLVLEVVVVPRGCKFARRTNVWDKKINESLLGFKRREKIIHTPR